MDRGPHLVLAPLALPWTLLSVIPGTLRRGLYLDPTRTGMVMLYRSNPVLDVLVLFPIMLIMFGAYFAATLASMFHRAGERGRSASLPVLSC